MNGVPQAQSRFNAWSGVVGVLRSVCNVLGQRRAKCSRNYLDDILAMDSPAVLCIDDSPQVLRLRKATLESHGYRVKIASERLYRDEDLEGKVRGSASLPYQATVS